MSGATLLRVPSAVPNDPPSALPNRFRPPVLHPFRHLVRRRADGKAARFEPPPRRTAALAEPGVARSPEPTTLSQRKEIG